MKKIFTLLFLIAAATSQAQNIIQVVKTDGTVHKYNIDSVERINFPTSESSDTTDFKTLYITYVTDTLYITETDTLYETVTTTDTLYITEIDTVYQDVLTTDTLYITETDTIYEEVHDTVTVTDDSDAIYILTFEDEDYKGSGFANGAANWTELIDSDEYGGDLLYGSGADYYSFYDEGNTELAWDGLNGYFWSFGYAVSNYWNPEIEEGSYLTQLSIATTNSTYMSGTGCAGGAEGSTNFLVMYCYRDDIDEGSLYISRDEVNPLYFADGECHYPQYVYVTNTTYTLNSLINGDDFANAATEETMFTLYAEGTDDDGNITRTSIPLCEATNAKREWIYFDLTPLGAVHELRFFVMGSDDLCGSYGLNTPGYAALDNLAVKF